MCILVFLTISLLNSALFYVISISQWYPSLQLFKVSISSSFNIAAL